MDPNQTIRTTPSRVDRLESRNCTLRTNGYRRDDWNSPDTTNPSNRNLEPGPILTTRSHLAHTRQEVTVSSLIDKTHSQKAAYRTIENRLDQAERELAEHRRNAQERNQPPFDPLRETLNPQITGAFSTPEILSARSGCYMGENSQQPPQQGMPQRSLSYSGLDKIETGLHGQINTLIQSQNIYTERPGEPRTRIPQLGNLTSENRTLSPTRTVRQTGFNNPIG
ncbi:hypothetical protein F2Q70_00011592 [Brassica cretica]|uniref:Uncharacterized protein n=1 Tax=Brassica cretica TaxID=69181 RepID=A0A3N6RYQ7_BRACR|nr:hypothetical protein F2Q70_00011592 [Brassica cretica]KAF3544807.1 hypothetical protein DY000_02006976 [Brassica cretica]